MTFTDDEAAFLNSHKRPIGCLATVSPDGHPDVVGVSYEFDGTYLYIGGLNQLKSRKYRNVLAGNTKVAFFLESFDQEKPQQLQWLRIYGTADLVERKGRFDSIATGAAEDRDSSQYIRITATTSWAFNLEGRDLTDFDPQNYKRLTSVRRNVHDAAEQALPK
ncbi:pyridoxamine 5'-phosphate oxidase family protein [Streptomyces sp. NPDC057257]|uniref:pyridoxamine 5'-phosphate oxidase family protein n=1 Tax=Streptomyces sp. NPDC057257 TaxID=3346071 RepID=UPI00363BA04E